MKQLARSERKAVHASNIANLVLFAAKVYASIESKSLAVIASTLDSLLDLLSGFILWFTAYSMKTPNHYYYPIGKNRMQPVVKTCNFATHFLYKLMLATPIFVTKFMQIDLSYHLIYHIIWCNILVKELAFTLLCNTTLMTFIDLIFSHSQLHCTNVMRPDGVYNL